MNIDINILLLVIIAILVISISWIIRLELRISKLLKGKGTVTIEESINTIARHIALLENFQKETEKKLAYDDKRIRRSIQAVKVNRFNPFKGTGAGGNQSFASAFIDEEGNGVVISSLYSRDRISVFAKGLTTYNSEFELSEEERDVVKKAEASIR